MIIDLDPVSSPQEVRALREQTSGLSGFGERPRMHPAWRAQGADHGAGQNHQLLAAGLALTLLRLPPRALD